MSSYYAKDWISNIIKKYFDCNNYNTNFSGYKMHLTSFEKLHKDGIITSNFIYDEYNGSEVLHPTTPKNKANSIEKLKEKYELLKKDTDELLTQIEIKWKKAEKAEKVDTTITNIFHIIGVILLIMWCLFMVDKTINAWQKSATAGVGILIFVDSWAVGLFMSVVKKKK